MDDHVILILGDQGCVGVPLAPLLLGYCYFPPMHPLFFHHLLLLFSLLPHFCELFAIFPSNTSWHQPFTNHKKTLCKFPKPIFPCSLLLAIIGHFHNCLLFHPSTLITNNHFVGKKKFKS